MSASGRILSRPCFHPQVLPRFRLPRFAIQPLISLWLLLQVGGGLLIAGPFTNGSFEVPQFAADTSLSGGSQVLTGWSISGIGTLVVKRGPYANMAPVDGVQHLIFNSGDAVPGLTLSQTFDTVPGAPYRAWVRAGRYGDGAGTMRFQVWVVSASGSVLGSEVVEAPTPGVYEGRQEFTFTASGPTSTIIIQDGSTATAGVDLLLDDVGVEAVVLEPICFDRADVVGWWRGEGDTLDAAGLNAGTAVGSLGYTNGVAGRAFWLPGVSSGITVPASPNLIVRSLTMEAWVYPNDLSRERPVFEYVSPGTAAGVNLWINHDRGVTAPGAVFANLRGFGLVNHSLVAPARTLASNVWHHLAVTYDQPSGEARLYVNGVAVVSTNFGSFSPMTANSLEIGRRPAGTLEPLGETSFFGFIDEPAVFRRALSADELAGIYRAGLSGKCLVECLPRPSGVVAWWRAEGTTQEEISQTSGVFGGEAGFSPGRVRQAFQFDGSGDGVRVGRPAALQLQAFTIEGWIRRASATQATLSAFGNGTFIAYGEGGYAFGIQNDGRLLLTRVGVDAVTSTTLIQDTNWHHVAVTTSGSEVVFYLDGVPGTPIPYATTFGFQGTLTLGAARDDLAASFLGSIDELTVYNRVLSGETIQAILDASAAGKCLGGAAPAECASVATGLRSWWQGESNGTDAIGGMTGQLLNGVAFGPGRVGDAFAFDGVDDHVRVPASGSLTTGSFTLDAWVYPTDLTTPRPIIDFGNPNEAAGVAFWMNLSSSPDARGALYADIRGVPLSSHILMTSGGALRSNEWQHVALTYDRPSGVANIYVNGAVVATGNLGSFTPLTDRDLNIGHRPQGSLDGYAGTTFKGLLDEVDFYARALSPAEVAAIVEASERGKCVCTSVPAGLVSWWSGETDAADMTGRNPGTPAGNVALVTGRVGNGFEFDGNGDGILLGAAPSLQLQDFTIEAWVKRSSVSQVSASSQYGEILGFGAGGYVFGFLPDGKPMLSKNGVDFVSSQRGITDTNWHHLAVTKAGTVVRFFVDGTLDVERTYDTTFVFGTPAVIGAVNATLDASFLGRIDELAVYNRPLTTNELAGIYVAGAAGKCPVFPPVIGSQPVGGTFRTGSSVTLEVSATGTGTLTYQWFFGTNAIANATTNVLTLQNVQPQQSGTYFVRVTSGVGVADSDGAVVTVIDPPSILVQPTNQTVQVGGTVSLSVVADGGRPLSYQWLRNGSPVAGASSPTLVLSNVQAARAGRYRVEVRNVVGLAMSAEAVLTVASGVMQASASGNGVLLSVNGESGVNYTIEWSVDLKTWDPLATIFNAPASWQFTDNPPPGTRQRFYRLRR